MKPITVTNNRYRLGYHLMAKAGWINDPNGFSYFKGYYHIFYQYYPYGPDWGPMHWGHARSKDLVHWETLPIALAPDEEDGCFSGSAVVYDNKLWLIYTGHHYYDKNDEENFYEDQRLAYSEDGIHFKKYEGNPVLTTPTDNTKHFRDPKVWKYDDKFYMVLGSQSKDGLGRALLYSSENLTNWNFETVLDKANTVKTEGYMWECPDFFRINGKDILLMSPQGLKQEGDNFRNLNQTGYLCGQLNKDNHLKRGNFVEIDRGHDFYATQTMLTPDGRRVMIAWMSAWDSEFPEKKDGWAGALTIPRELVLHGEKLYQKPVKELKLLRESQEHHDLKDKSVYGLAKSHEFIIKTNDFCDDKILQLSDGKQSLIISVDKEKNKIVLCRSTKDGERTAKVNELSHLEIHVFCDTSSVELFINGGEAVFTERMYWNSVPKLCVSDSVHGTIDLYKLDNSAITY